MIENLESAYGDGLSWLLELELVDNPAVLNALILNIFKTSMYIKDAEVLTDYNNKRMLVWLDLNWFGKRFFQKKIEKNLNVMLSSALPNYQFRIVTDKALLDAAIAKFKKTRGK